MTEKQYRLNKWGTRLLKNNRPLFDWTNEPDEIVDLLNKLNDKNEQLKKSVKRQQDSNNECAKLIKEQQKENEWLKSEIQKLYNFVKIDVDHNIEVYPKSLMELILEILKIIGDDGVVTSVNKGVAKE